MDWIESEYSAETTMRFARSGALVRIVTDVDACEVCRAMAGRVYLPSDVPRLPIRGCARDECRCSFVAVDPETKQTVPELVQWGARVVKEGRADLARHILRRAVSLDERYELGWLWLSAVVDDETKIDCLEKVLALNPHNKRAAAGLAALRSEREAEPASSTSAPVPPTRTLPAASPRSRPLVSAQVAGIREERQVILGQWRQFVEFAVNTDARTLAAQGRAFLNKLDGLDQKALALLDPDAHLDELRLQWQELAERTAVLQEVFPTHPAQDKAAIARQTMQDATESLLRQLVERQHAVRKQMSVLEGSVG